METDVFTPSPSEKKDKKAMSGVAAKAGVMAGAGVAGVGLGAAAGNIFDGRDVENAEAFDTESMELASGAGVAADTIPEQNPAVRPEMPVQPEPEDIVTPDPIVEDNVVEPSPNPTPANPGDTQVVTPEEIDEDPDIAAIISGEELDPRDVDMAQVVTFDELGTIYTVDGEELMAAAFHLEDGFEGIMVDVDSDGVFDNLAVLTDEGYVNVAEAPGYTVDDVELQLNPEVNYLAQNDEVDHTLVDDDFADDIIDVTLA